METQKNPGQLALAPQKKPSTVLVDQLNLDKAPGFRLLKQNQLSLFLKGFLESFGEIETISFNENINGFYPDVKFSFMDVHFIIEIDEFQHKRGLAYSKDREKKRIQALRASFKSLVLVRINPDRCNDRRTPMITTLYNEKSKEREIIVNAGEAEYRYEEISKLLRWIFFSVRQQQGSKTPERFAEFKLFFDA